MAQQATTASTSGKVLPLERIDLTIGQKHRSLWNNAWHQYRHHRLAVAGLVIFLSFVVATVIGPLIYPRDKDYIDFMLSSLGPFQSWTYPLGTDTLGRDILARLLWGGRISLAVGVISALMSITIGTLIGAAAGYFGGFLDSLLMRMTDLFISLPQVPLLLMISFLFRDSIQELFDKKFNNGELGIFILIVVVIALLSWMPTARLVRASFLSIKEKEFIEAARSIGVSQSSIVFKHILPNSLSPIIVAATLAVGAAIITESVLSFLGLGFPSDVPTWGRMLNEARDYLQLTPHEAMIPGTAIFLTVLAINYIGDGLRDALDPRKTQ
jgi:peptide/nickel transport system permease protein